ncbi:ATP-binding protein [Streptomyces inhibens]|uniref:ATP-binding protein n=1 Tax=Streptomyces inhibens TaxID=2293571 RepID=UPI0031457042
MSRCCGGATERSTGSSPAPILPRDPAVARCARRLVTWQPIRWGLESLVTDTALNAGELVTNAIRHGAGPIAPRLIKHQPLSCEVSEAGRTCPRLRHTRSTDEDGRGILLVSQLSRRWGRRRITGGKVVRAEQELPHPAEGESDTGFPPDPAGAAWPNDAESRGEELT